MLGANHVFTVNSTEVKVYPSFYPKINSIYDSSPILSSILGNSRKISIYYPPSYYDNTFKKYELLLLHDGQNLFDNSKAAFGVAWMVQNTTNTYIA
jgi:enterochelin esterase-like enzyme